MKEKVFDKTERYLLTLGFTYLITDPAKRDVIKADRETVKRALSFLSDEAKDLVGDMIETDAWREEKKRHKSKAWRDEMRKTAEENRVRTERLRAQRARDDAQRAKTQARMKVTYETNKKLIHIGKAVVSLFDTLKIDGRPIGNIWYSELDAIRRQGAFEAHICQAILRHGKPSKDTKVRDLITEKKLAEFVAAAKGPVRKAA